jgi:hypothetical protein
MKELNGIYLEQVSGGFHINLGTIAATLAVGLVTGGPAGMGIAATGLIINHGVNNLNELHNQPPGK